MENDIHRQEELGAARSIMNIYEGVPGIYGPDGRRRLVVVVVADTCFVASSS